MENGVHYKALLGLVYLGICQGNSPGATSVNKRIALRFCRLYFNLVLVPGSTAYRIFQESLFQSAVQCFRLPSKNNSSGSDGTASGNSSQNASGRAAGRGGRRKQNAAASGASLDNCDAGGERSVTESETISESMLFDFMTDMLRDLG
ncbi:hypothetical protein V5799_031514 [Amblyomma americanum]|uniref:Uncharacterized protein n=1 Tax=Amblyomma americanum TaxID=6943 RepID=A0AAQ4EKL8_AMBAM